MCTFVSYISELFSYAGLFCYRLHVDCSFCMYVHFVFRMYVMLFRMRVNVLCICWLFVFILFVNLFFSCWWTVYVCMLFLFHLDVDFFSFVGYYFFVCRCFFVIITLLVVSVCIRSLCSCVGELISSACIFFFHMHVDFCFVCILILCRMYVIFLRLYVIFFLFCMLFFFRV